MAWTDQLAATATFLSRLAPIARDLGIHINLETHEEITSFELVRIVETVGPDVTGVTFDTANVLQRAEHPVWAARRLAPYVRQSHIKDAGIFRAPDGLRYQMRPNGQGMVDLVEILPILYAGNPELHLSLEVRDFGGAPTLPRRGPDRRAPISLYDPEWLAGHPDLTVDELVAYLALVQDYDNRITAGDVPDFDAYNAQPWTVDDAWDYVRASRDYVAASAAANGIPLDAVRTAVA